jgi:uncharacterized membrane protein
MNVTQNEQKVLDALTDRDGGIYSHELVAYSGVSKEAIGGVVSSLIKKGAVRKSKIGQDEYIEVTERVVFGYTSSSSPKVYLLRAAA